MSESGENKRQKLPSLSTKHSTSVNFHKRFSSIRDRVNIPREENSKVLVLNMSQEEQNVSMQHPYQTVRDKIAQQNSLNNKQILNLYAEKERLSKAILRSRKRTSMVSESIRSSKS